MKTRIFILSVLIAVSSFAYAQQPVEEDVQQTPSENKSNMAVSAGFLMGGGGLIGVDVECVIPSTRFGVQIGAGIGSFGGGLNYHLKETPNSSFLSFQYWQQGFGNNHYASYIGPMFVFRSKKLFQAGLGLGNVIKKGPKWDVANKTEQARNVSVSLMYHIGMYF